ncbi:MAG: zinc ABC transporter substrate-binding protein [bacterium]
MKRLFIVILILFIASSAIIFFTTKKAGINSDKKLIVTSFSPITELVKEIGKDKINLVNIVPSDIEPHDFEPKPQDIINIQESKLFIYNSAIDKWTKTIKRNAELDTINLVTGSLITTNNGIDPHIWLDPTLVKKQAESIASALSEIDPVNKDYYLNNLLSYSRKLDNLNSKYVQGLTNCKQRNIVTSHEAFGYIGKKYSINIINIAGLSPEEEPSAQKLAEIKNIINEKGINYIFFETLTSPKIAETLSQETGAKVAVLNPLEGLKEEEKNSGKNYFTVMEDNLNILKQAMQCE